jgi:hypothetical protein
MNSEVNLIDFKGDLTGWIKMEGRHDPGLPSVSIIFRGPESIKKLSTKRELPYSTI